MRCLLRSRDGVDVAISTCDEHGTDTAGWPEEKPASGIYDVVLTPLDPVA